MTYSFNTCSYLYYIVTCLMYFTVFLNKDDDDDDDDNDVPGAEDRPRGAEDRSRGAEDRSRGRRTRHYLQFRASVSETAALDTIRDAGIPSSRNLKTKL